MAGGSRGTHWLRGQKLTYNARWKGPWDSDVQRKVRDPLLIPFFGIFFISWLISGIIIIIVTSLRELKVQKNNIGHYIIKFQNQDELDLTKMFIYGIPTIAVCAFLTIILSIVSLHIARGYAREIMWSSVGYVLCAFAFLTFLPALVVLFTMDSGGTDLVLSGTLFSTVIICISCGCVMFCHRKIDISAELIREACKATLDFPSLFLLSLCETILALLATLFYVTVMTCLIVNHYLYNYDGALPIVFPFLYLFHTAGWIWTKLFISAVSKMTIYGAVASWFWTMDKNNVDNNIVFKSFFVTIKYHLGSIAFGTLVLVIFKCMRSAVQTSEDENERGAFLVLVEWITERFFAVVEQGIAYINSKAYVTCIVHGTDFFDSAKFTFQLIYRNAVFAFILSYVTDIVIFSCRFITILIPTLCSLIVTIPLGGYYYCITFIVFVVCFIVSGPFFSLISSAISAIFVSALEDWERNDGTEVKPYFMSSHLRTIMLEVV